MAACNAHYYATRDPLGVGGDFTTAPEIDQMFGEMVGACLADCWHRAGAPEKAIYAELGPGRGTLAADALRVIGAGVEAHLVETSPALREAQQTRVPGATFHAAIEQLPPRPLLLVANEFLDALPVRQLVRTETGWRERMVGYYENRFLPIAGRMPMEAAVPEARREAPVGTIIETCPAAAATVQEVARRLAAQGGAALFFDYGHDEVRDGSTLQAVRAHEKVDPFATPGEADLTAHVDFATLARIAQDCGARWLGTVPQGEWLKALGADARALALGQVLPAKAMAIWVAKERLVAADQMGALFKVLGLAAPGWPDGEGFAGPAPGVVSE